MDQLLKRLYARAGIAEFSGHDLRRSFATLAVEAGSDHFLAMRLLRDKIPGQGERYIKYLLSRLVEDLKQYSPLRIIEQKETGSGVVSEPVNVSGGDGGELNSPSSPADLVRLLPELLDQMILLGELARQINRALGDNGRRPEEVARLIRELKMADRRDPQ
jgi:hypothetical protein